MGLPLPEALSVSRRSLAPALHEERAQLFHDILLELRRRARLATATLDRCLEDVDLAHTTEIVGVVRAESAEAVGVQADRLAGLPVTLALRLQVLGFDPAVGNGRLQAERVGLGLGEKRL